MHQKILVLISKRNKKLFAQTLSETLMKFKFILNNRSMGEVKIDVMSLIFVNQFHTKIKLAKGRLVKTANPTKDQFKSCPNFQTH